MRIGNGPSGLDLTAQFSLLNALSQLSQSSVRLSTMKRVNSGADDPAGLIAIENLRAEITAINKAGDNAARAAATVRVADSALDEVSNLMNTLRGNMVSAAGGGLSDAELEALQIENNAALDAINRIGNTTSFGGRRLLDGTAGSQAEGLTFVFSPDVHETSSVELPNINTAALGGASGSLSDLAAGGAADIDSGNFGQAMQIIDDARSDVLGARARMGAFEKYTIESAQEVLGSMELNLTSSLSQILDTDVAAESSNMMRSQILVEAATSAVMLASQNRGMIRNLFGDF